MLADVNDQEFKQKQNLVQVFVRSARFMKLHEFDNDVDRHYSATSITWWRLKPVVEFTVDRSKLPS